MCFFCKVGTDAKFYRLAGMYSLRRCTLYTRTVLSSNCQLPSFLVFSIVRETYMYKVLGCGSTWHRCLKAIEHRLDCHLAQINLRTCARGEHVFHRDGRLKGLAVLTAWAKYLAASYCKLLLPGYFILMKKLSFLGAANLAGLNSVLKRCPLASLPFFSRQ